MNNENRKTIEPRVYVKTILLIIVLFVIITGGISVISQNQKTSEDAVSEKSKKAENTPEASDSTKEVQKLLTILKDGETANTRETILDAVKKLGDIRDKAAIPELIRYLDYEKKQVDAPKQDPYEVTSWDSVPLSGRFPATAALFQIGEASMPALVEVIETETLESVKSQNALFTVQFIYRDDLSKAVAYLENAKTKASSEDKKQKLADAIEKTGKEYQKIQKLKANKN